jgi:hypothetical protein
LHHQQNIDSRAEFVLETIFHSNAHTNNTEHGVILGSIMDTNKTDHVPMTVWCTLIPPEELDRFSENEEDLQSVSEAYEDWLVSMRSKSFVGTDVGVMLDRIRILMINIGIACATNRTLAEEVQSVVSEHLQARALTMVEKLPAENSDGIAVKMTLEMFFRDIKFTRDIFPEEDIKRLIPAKVPVSADSSKSLRGRLVGPKTKSTSPDETKILQASIQESSNVMKKLYMRLLSPDPWGMY